MTVAEVLELVVVAPPGLAVTLYELTAAPPVENGAVHTTEACPFPGDAETFVGAPGALFGATGVIADDAFDGYDVPIAFVAVTLNV